MGNYFNFFNKEKKEATTNKNEKIIIKTKRITLNRLFEDIYNKIENITYIKSLNILFLFVDKIKIACFNYPTLERNEKLEEILNINGIRNYFYLGMANKLIIYYDKNETYIYNVRNNILKLDTKINLNFFPQKLIEVNSNTFIILENGICSTYKYINNNFQKINSLKVESNILDFDINPSKNKLIIVQDETNFTILLYDIIKFKILSKYENTRSSDVYFLNEEILISFGHKNLNLYNINNSEPDLNWRFTYFLFTKINDNIFAISDFYDTTVYKIKKYGQRNDIESIFSVSDRIYCFLSFDNCLICARDDFIRIDEFFNLDK